MRQNSEKLFRSSLLSVSFLTIMASTSVSPLLASIARSFPNANAIEVKMVLTVPVIVSLIFSQVCGVLSLFISKKKLLLIGIGLYTAGGCFCVFPGSLPMLIVYRAIVGIGLGIVAPLSTGLIADYYGGQKGARLIGISQAVAQVGSMAGTLFSGVIADINWRLAFVIYGVGFPIFILILLVLPDSRVKPQERKGIACHLSSINRGVIPLFAMAFVFSLIFSNITINISQYVQYLKSDVSAAGIGICIMAFGGLLGSAAVPRMLEKLKRLTLPLLLFIVALGYFFLSHAVSLSGLMPTLFLLGLSGGAFSTGLFALAAQRTSFEQHTIGMAVITAGNSIGTFLTPFLCAGTQIALHTVSLVTNFYTNAVEMLLFACIVRLAGSKHKEA